MCCHQNLCNQAKLSAVEYKHRTQDNVFSIVFDVSYMMYVGDDTYAINQANCLIQP